MADFDCFPNFHSLKGLPILAVDYGSKYTGLATFTPGDTPFPCPWGRLAYSDDATLVRDVLRVATQESIEILVVGIPRLVDGKETEQTARVKHFASMLRLAAAPIPVYEQDETLSTFEAEDRMRHSPRYNFKVDLREIDALAASIILEDFIRCGKRE